jgi:hypothetical protein
MLPQDNGINLTWLDLLHPVTAMNFLLSFFMLHLWISSFLFSCYSYEFPPFFFHVTAMNFLLSCFMLQLWISSFLFSCYSYEFHPFFFHVTAMNFLLSFFMLQLWISSFLVSCYSYEFPPFFFSCHSRNGQAWEALYLLRGDHLPGSNL